MPTERPLRVGVLGCGYIADIHVRSLQRTGPVDLVAADVDPAAAARLVAEHGGRVVAPAELLDLADLDVVHLCTPHDVRAEPLRRLARSGALVVCEKPLALTGDEAVTIRDALGPRADRVVVAFNQRFMPGVRELHRWLGEARADPRRVRIDITTPPFLDGWAGTAEHGGGILVGVGSHAVDLWRHLLGRHAVDVDAVGARAHVGPHLEHDTATVTVVDDAGMISTLTLQDSGSTWWSMTARRMLDIDIRLTDGAVRAGPVALTTWDDARAESRSVLHIGAEPSDFLEEWGYAPMARAVRERAAGRPGAADGVLATVDDGVECARLVQSAHRALEARDQRRNESAAGVGPHIA